MAKSPVPKSAAKSAAKSATKGGTRARIPSFDDVSRRIRARLTALRLERKFSLQQAAELSGFSRNGLEKMETGEVQPTLESLLKLTLFYGENFPHFLAAAFAEAEIACQVHSELVAKAVEAHEKRRMFLTLAGELGMAPFLDDLTRMQALAESSTEAYAAFSLLLKSLAEKMEK